MQEESKRYNRHLKLDKVGLEGQKNLSSTSVLVIGAGGLGCPVMQSIVSAGIGRVGIVDGDVVSESNLQRQFLYSLKDVGESKCIVVGQKLGVLNPLVNIETHDYFINDDNILKVMEGYDIVADCTDNMDTKYLINDAAVRLGKPVIFGALHTFQGQFGVYNFENSKTYRCIFPNNQTKSEPQNCSDIGVWSVLPGIIGTMQANEILKIAAGLDGVLADKIGIYDAFSGGMQLVTVKRNELQVTEALKRNFNKDSIESRRLSKTEFLLRAQSKDSIVVDLRHLKNEAAVHSALEVDAGKINVWKREIHRDKEVLLFCNRGNTSLKILKELIQDGYNAFDLRRGMNN
ncbi:MAG: ThiF family adenylyltransferase [Bacteroidia bacterium]